MEDLWVAYGLYTRGEPMVVVPAIRVLGLLAAVSIGGCMHPLVDPAMDRHVIELRNTSDRHLEVSLTSQTPTDFQRKHLEVAPQETVSTRLYVTSSAHMPAITFKPRDSSSPVGPIYLGKGFRSLQQAVDQPHRFDIIEYRGALLLVPADREEQVHAPRGLLERPPPLDSSIP